MATPYRGYTEIPGSVTPDVPYRVNLALREIDADVDDAVKELEKVDQAQAGRLAALESAAGFGSGMKLQDDAVNALLLNKDTATSKHVHELVKTEGPAAVVAQLDVPASPVREAFDAYTLRHLSDNFRGPLKEWGAALASSKTKPAIWVNLGSSTANGGTTTYVGQQWAQRVAAYITGRSTLDNAALPRLEGVTTRPANGVHAYTGAIGGTQSSNYITTEHMAAIKALQPALISHMVGSNDYGSGIALSTYKTRLRNHMDQLQAAAPNAVHLYIHQQPRNDIAKPVAPWHAYGDAMREVAAAYPNVAFLDASVYFPGEGAMPGHIMAEAVHMNEAGHKVMADVVAAAMGTPIYYARESITPTWTGRDNAAGVDSLVMQHAVPAAPYPREITVHANVYAYGKAAHGSMGAEMGIRAGYNDDVEALTAAGPLYQFRVEQGGANYAQTYSASKTYHCDANRPFWVFFLAGGNCYVSGTNTYTDFKIIAEPA